MSRFRLAVLLPFTFALMLAGCGGSTSPDHTAFEPLSPSFTHDGFALKIAPESLFAGGEFTLEAEKSSAGVELLVKASRVIGLKALYVSLDYDREQYEPVAAESTGLMGADRTLQLAVLDEPGRVHHGQVLAGWPQLEGFSGDGVLTRLEFKRLDSRSNDHTPRTAAAVPVSDAAAHSLFYNRSTSLFAWYYTNPGDYDQNSMVTVSDLTPLGANFSAIGPFDPASALAVVDGNSDGQITVSDITPIGQNFGNSIDSFELYGSTSAADYPATNSGANGHGAVRFGRLDFADGSEGGTARRRWALELDEPILGGRYWMRPLSDGAPGTPSNLTSEHSPQWHLSEVHAYEPPGETTSARGLGTANINGRPAAVLTVRDDEGDSEFLYIRAADQYGTDWHSPAVALSRDNLYGEASLAAVSGHPAITWLDDQDVGGMLFMRAANEEGTVWGLPVIVDDYINAGLESRLMTHSGMPVAVYSNGGDQMYVSVGLDAEGTAWSEPQLLFEPGFTSALDAAVTGTGLAVALKHRDDFSVHFFRVDIVGSAAAIFPGTELLPPDPGGALFVGVDVADGVPYVVTARGDDRKLYYTSASTADGLAWVPAVSTGLTGGALRADVMTAYGTPWVVYFDSADQTIRSGRAAEAGSSTWLEEADVAEGLNGADFVSMLRAGIHPAVMYVDSNEKKLMFGVYY